MLKYLIEKEFKQIIRNPFLPKLILVFPFMVLTILPMAANFEVRNVTVSLVDHDRSSISTRLISKISASPYFKINSIHGTYDLAIGDVEQDNADLVLIIPLNFERDLVNNSVANVQIAANMVNSTKGGLGSYYLASIIREYNAEVQQEFQHSIFGQAGQGAGRSGFAELELTGLDSNGVQVDIEKAGNPGGNMMRTVVPRFEVIPRFWFNPHLRYPFLMVPAIMVMLMAMLCGFLPALNIVGEKQSGTIEQMNVTPVRRFDFILAKLIPYWVIGFIILTMSFGVARLVYGLVPAGSILTIYLFASMFVLAMSGLGLVISNYAKTVQQAMFMMFFFVVTFIFMSGLYTPVSSMPDWAQMIGNFSPLKYFIMVMRQVYLKGSGLMDLGMAFVALVGFAVFFNTWAVLSYRKTSS